MNYDEILLYINEKRPNLPPLIIDDALNTEARAQAYNVYSIGRFSVEGEYKSDIYKLGICSYDESGFNLFIAKEELLDNFKYVGIGECGGICVVLLQKPKPEEKSEPLSWLASLIKPVIDWFYGK